MEIASWKKWTVAVLIVIMLVFGYVGERVSNPTLCAFMVNTAIGILITLVLGLVIWTVTEWRKK